MASKLNDLMLNIIANPLMSLGDFQSVGLSIDNTSLEDEDVYLNSNLITENPLFQGKDGTFDKVKFHLKYLEASLALQSMAMDNNKDFKAVYSKYNIFAPVDQVDFKPQYELTKALNPDRLTRSMITVGQTGPREKTASEIAQSQQVFNSETGEWMDTPEDMFSFGKLFSDFTGFFSDNFGSAKVLATYDEDVDINGRKRGEIGFDENLIEHTKGEYKLNENGTYYYRTLKDGENVYGKELLHYSDILTREGSVLNSVDFLDSDDIQKTPIGSFVKNASLIGSFFLPYVGPAIVGATLLQQSMSLGATLGKLAFMDNDNPTFNWLEGLAEATNPMETRSEDSRNNSWTVENLLGMVGDVVGQLYQQRLLFKYAPAVFKGKWGISEKNLETLKNLFIEQLLKESKGLLKDVKDINRLLKILTEINANASARAAAMLEDYMKDYYNVGGELSKAYMTLLTVNDIYGEAKEAGATDFDAALITTGYAAMEYALLSTDIGKWILPELRAERLENKAVVKALTKKTKEAFKQLSLEAKTSEVGRKNYIQSVLDWGKSIFKTEFANGLGKKASIENGTGLLKGGLSSLIAGATAEATEEVSEEFLGDFTRVLFNGLLQLKGNDVRLKPFENGWDRYSMSFLGGFLGGGISSASMDFSLAKRNANMTFDQAVLKIVYKARNNELDGIYKILDEETIGNKDLSARKTVKDDKGNVIWKQADGNDNLDFVIKQNVRRLLDLIQNTLNAHGGNRSDLSILEVNTLKDIRFRALQRSTTAGKFIQHYNELLTELVLKVQELESLNTPQAKAESGEGDLKNEKSSELEKNRKKIEEEIKSLDKLIEDMNTGKLAPLFMTSALLETTPFISAPFMYSSFRYYAEKHAKTKFENIPKAKLEELTIKYLEYLRTSKKDDLDLATHGYLNLLGLIRDNFKLAEKLAKDTINDPEIKDYIETFTLNLSIFSLNLLGFDDDTWVEKLLLFASEANIGNKILDDLKLLRNTLQERTKTLLDTLTQAEQKRLNAIDTANLAFELGLIDEEGRDNTIKNAEEEYNLVLDLYNQENHSIEDYFNKLRESLVTLGRILAAQNLADHIIKLGYMNGAIKSNVLAQLKSSVEIALKLKEQIEYDDINMASADLLDSLVNLMDYLDSQINDLNDKIEKINKLPYTPILLNLDTFALNINGGNISNVLKELGKQINNNRQNLSAFTFQGDIYKQVNEALRVIDLYIAALEGARVDTVDPFKVGMNARGEVLDKSNIWGINRVLNEVHAKSPKIENDPWQDLPEIEGEIADMMITDARSIKKLLHTYKRLYNINEGQKLNVQTRVAIKTTYLLYNKLRLCISVEALKDFNFGNLEATIEKLTLLKRETEKNKEDWNLNLSLQEQIQLEKERIELEDALYNFFNVDNEGLAKDVEKLKKFLSLFKLLDSRTELLSEDATDIDETSFIGYLASKAAMKSSEFYGMFKEVISDGKVAPIISLELGVQLLVANVLNGNVITSFINAYREVLKDNFSAASFEERKRILKEEFGESEAVAALFATKEGSKYYPNHDSVPLFTNITFIDGIPGSGKSAGVDLLTVKFLLRHYPDLLKNIWVSHGGDSTDDRPFTIKFKKDIGLGDDPNLAFSKEQLMKKISEDWSPAKLEDGKTYKIEDSDYTFEDGQIVPTWKLNNIDESELPSLIIIDEALQFTLLDLMLIDKFARKHGISVIMSGDLQQSKSSGEFKIPKKTIQNINSELKENKLGFLFDEDNTSMSVQLSRNLVLHTPKLGTSMRTANNLKNINLSGFLIALLDGQGDINLHYFEDDESLTGDILVNPDNIDLVYSLLDKILPKLQDKEKINYAYDNNNSKIVEALKNNKKYADKINFIKGTALGQEGNYWIIEPNYSISDEGASVKDVKSFLSDLYTGISRSKIASIVISPENINNGTVKLSNIKDIETHEIKYSPEAINKYAKKRIEILDNVISTSKKIEYNPRDKVEEKEVKTEVKKETPEEKKKVSEEEKKEGRKRFEEEARKLLEGGIIRDTLIDDSNLEEAAIQFVKNGIQLIPSQGLTSHNDYNTLIIDYYGRPIVVIDINGFKMPFYMSTGLGGKKNVKPAKWYPFFGINPDLEWLTKLFEDDINAFYGSPLLKAICDVLNTYYPVLVFDENFGSYKTSPYVNPQNGEDIPLTNPGYKPMIDFIDQSVGYGDKHHPNKTRQHIEEVIKELHDKAGYVGNTEDETNNEVDDDVLEVVSDVDISSEEEAQKLLEDATYEDNPDSDEEIEPTGLSIDKFSFFLFSNATFELGTSSIDRQNNTYLVSSNLYSLYRIDGVNGLKNCPGVTSVIGDLSRSERVLGNLRRYLLSVKDKSDLETKIARALGLNGVYVRYAIKTSEFDTNGINKPHYGKLEKDISEELQYCRAKQDPTSESNHVNNRNLVAIIGTDDNGDAIEIPLLTLNNPITLIKIHDSNGKFKFPDVYDVYKYAYDLAISNGYPWNKAQIEGLLAVVGFTLGKPEYKALQNLINLYLRTDRNILFIPDVDWTPSRNLKSFGPQLHLHRGNAYFDLPEYDNADYVLESRWISLDELKLDPTLYISKVYELLDKAELSLNLAQPKHPFVLYTDLAYGHDGTVLASDEALIKEYLWLKQDKNRPLNIKLVYVLPPKFTLLEYLNSLKVFMEDNKNIHPLGNLRTAYKILETLFLLDLEGTKNIFTDAFGKETGEQIYYKIFEVVNRLKDLSVKDLIVELKKVYLWPSFNGVGLTNETNLYRHLQHFLKQLVYPGGIALNGTVVSVVLRSGGHVNLDILNRLIEAFNRSGLSLFYLCKASKNSEDIIEGIFSPVLTDDEGHINDPNMLEKEFSINGNISSSTFLAEEGFNRILDFLVNNIQNTMEGGNIGSWNNPAYTGDPNAVDVNRYPRGYSGWNMKKGSKPVGAQNNPPSISRSILNKLDSLGIKDIKAKPTKENDDSIELKRAIADEINNIFSLTLADGTPYSPYLAIVLPNEELIIANQPSLHRTTPVEVIVDTKSFESNQQYLFSLKYNGRTLNIVYNPRTKKASYEEKYISEGYYDFNSCYEAVTEEFVKLNLDRFKSLLIKLSNINSFDSEFKEKAKKLSEGNDINEITNFFNDILTIYAIAENNFNEKLDYVDILKFTKTEDEVCNVQINMQFI